MDSKPPSLPSTAPGGEMVPHLSARRRHQIVDTVFEMTGGTERLADWADKNYGDFITGVWVKGLPKAVAVEHSPSQGLEAMLKKLDERDKTGGAQILDAPFKEVSNAVEAEFDE